LISTEIFVLVLIKFFASQIAFEGFCLSIVFCFGASVLAVVLSFFSVPLFVVVFTFVLLSGVCGVV
jgi:small-conductance mechanosensitive channel